MPTAGSYICWYAENMWLFVPIQQKVKEFISTIPDYPFQEGSSLSRRDQLPDPQDGTGFETAARTGELLATRWSVAER